MEFINGLEEKSLDGRLAESTGNLLILPLITSLLCSLSCRGSVSSINDRFR